MSPIPPTADWKNKNKEEFGYEYIIQGTIDEEM